MTKSDLILKIMERVNFPKDYAELYTKDSLEAFISTVNEVVNNGEKVKISGFGVFSLKVRKPGIVRNPKTGEKLESAGSKTIKFSPSKS